MSDRSSRFDYVPTKDGSYTLYSKEYDECYHNKGDGALGESLHKHVIPAISYALTLQKDRLNILDICFGLGYNTFATLYYVKRNGIDLKLNIYSPELDCGLIKSLVDFEYPETFNEYAHIIEAVSRAQKYVSGDLNIDVGIMDAKEYISGFSDSFFDVVYQDPFSAKKSPALWDEQYFELLSGKIRGQGVLTTYSKARATKELLLKNGFRLKSRDGVGIKSSLVAYKN